MTRRSSMGWGSLPVLLALCGANPAAVAAQESPPPPSYIQFTFHLIEANGFEGVDEEIADVVEELEKVFRFEGYRLLSTSVITSVPHGRFSQRISVPRRGVFDLYGEVDAVYESGERVGDLHRLNIALGGRLGNPIPDPDEMEEQSLLNAAVNIRDGQTIVLGSSRPNPEMAALILVVTGRLAY